MWSFATIDIESKILRATLELNKPHGDQILSNVRDE